MDAWARFCKSPGLPMCVPFGSKGAMSCARHDPKASQRGP